MSDNKHNLSSNSVQRDGMLNKIINREMSNLSVYSNRRGEYPELYLFRNQIEIQQDNPQFKPYTITKSRVMLYRWIFLSIGFIYFILGSILYNKTLTWPCTFLFGSSFPIKTFLLSFCSISAASSLVVGFSIKSEREAVKRLCRQFRQRVQKIYERKLVKFEVKRFLSFGREYRKSTAFKQLYQDALEKIEEYKEDAMHLLDGIAKSPSLDDRMKEELFNQAILELKDKMSLLTKTYHSTNPPKFIQNLSAA